jgi:hypothetical protein
MAISKIKVGSTEHEINATNDSNGNKISSTYIPKSGGTLNDSATLKFSTYGTRSVTISGNSISADMSKETGGWEGNFASVKDPSGATTSMLGWYGNASGLTHIYMGGTYRDPFLKFTPAGQFTFKNTPKVGSTDVALKTDIPSTSGLASTTYVDNKVAGLVDSAPGTLDTLNELAAALGDDPNFATTVATQIGNKVDKTTTVNGHALSGNVSVTKSDVGLGNVENKSSATIRGELTKANVTTALGYTPPTKDTTYSGATTSTAGLMSAADKTKLDGIATGANNFALPYRLSSYQASGTGSVSDPNNATETGFYYVSSSSTNRPPFSQSSNLDYRLLVTAYGSTWLQQIATDFRCDDIFYRRKENGTWKSWVKIYPTAPTKTSQLTNDSSFIPASASNKSKYQVIDDSANSASYEASKITYGKDGVGSYALSFPTDSGTLALTKNIPTKTSELTNDSGFKTTDSNTTYTFATNKNATNASAQLRLTAGGSGSGNQSVQVIGANGIKVTTNASGNALTITGASSSATKVYCHQYKITLNSYASPPYATITYTLYSTSSTTLENSSNFLEILRTRGTVNPFSVYVYDAADGQRMGTEVYIASSRFYCYYMTGISSFSSFNTTSYSVVTTINQV